MRFLPRLLSLFARFATGLDIHPGATIGRRVLIDHGAAVVIGETAVVGDDVVLYHQVTLGAVGWWKDITRAPGSKRHPTLENAVVVGANASVLGPITIGRRSLVGAHALVLESVPPDSCVRAHPAQVLPSDGLEAANGRGGRANNHTIVRLAPVPDEPARKKGAL
jgi:serine O-acetyltransferase